MRVYVQLTLMCADGRVDIARWGARGCSVGESWCKSSIFILDFESNLWLSSSWKCGWRGPGQGKVSAEGSARIRLVEECLEGTC